LSFDVALHLGTLLAVLVFFAADWVRLFRAGLASQIEHKIGTDFDRRLAWLLVLGCIPGGIAGALGESKIEHLFHELNMPIKLSAMMICLAQAIAIFRGVSRSGSTITAGLTLVLEQVAAARFSFLLSAPTIAGAGLKSLWDIYHTLPAGGFTLTEWLLFPIGCIAAAMSGFLCIKYLLRFFQRNSTDIFVYYHWILAGLLIVIAVV
jgi:undecaprenyl-diphosphatase